MNYLKHMTLVLMIFCISLAGFAQNTKDEKIMKDADMAIENLTTYNSGIQNYFDSAAGYAVFPNVGKGGLIVGGASGNGVLYENGAKVGMVDLKELNVGFQAGGQALVEVIFFETQEDIDKFKMDNYQFDAGISATALKSGVSMNAKYEDGVAVFTHTKGGLMAEVSVGGQRFEYDAF